MEDVPEHDPELEREGNDIKERRVDFFLTWDSLGICDCLEDFSQTILSEVCRRV